MPTPRELSIKMSDGFDYNHRDFDSYDQTIAEAYMQFVMDVFNKIAAKKLARVPNIPYVFKNTRRTYAKHEAINITSTEIIDGVKLSYFNKSTIILGHKLLENKFCFGHREYNGVYTVLKDYLLELDTDTNHRVISPMMTNIYTKSGTQLTVNGWMAYHLVLVHEICHAIHFANGVPLDWNSEDYFHGKEYQQIYHEWNRVLEFTYLWPRFCKANKLGQYAEQKQYA